MSSVASQLSGTPALAPRQLLPSSVLSTALLQIALGASETADVLDSRVSANSVILVQVEQAAPDATAISFSVVKTNNKSFKIKAGANATAITNVRYAILQY